MNLTLLTDAGPADEPVSLAEARDHLRIDPSMVDDDGLIQTLITAARLEGEAASGRELARKQFSLVLDAFPPEFQARPYWNGRDLIDCRATPREIRLLDPLVTVDGFKYKSADASVTSLAVNTDYIVDIAKHPGVVCPAPNTNWPAPAAGYWPSSAVEITFTAGFTPVTVPAKYKQGILLLVSQWFENRIPFEAIRFVAELPFSVSTLFMSDRLPRF